MKWTRSFALALSTIFLLVFSGQPAQAQAAKALEGDMVQIPAGHFIFGTDKKDESAEALSLGIPKPWYVDENPQQKIFLKGFYIDRFEVTNKRYKIYIDELGAVPPENWTDNNYAEGEDDFPITLITWFDAANFCQWAGKELPTEKQWERAARGNAGLEYPWGNEFDPTLANLAEKSTSKNKPAKVGSHPEGASPEGVHDLIGNVWEWVKDDYAAYKGSEYKNEYLDAGYKVFRGQSSSNIGHFPGPMYKMALKQFARSGHREFSDPDQGGPDVGFRCSSREKPAGLAPVFGGSKPPATASLNQDNSKAASPFPDDSSSDSGFSGANPFAVESNLPQSGFLVLIVLSFIAGVFSFLSPCTLPILPAYFAVTAQADRTRISLMSVAFFCGLATLFVAMGASASLLGQVLRDYLFSLTTAGGVAVAIFGVMTLFGKGFSGATFQGKPASSFFGFFLFGATFALGWTPCVGPILSGILILAASDKTVIQGMALLFFYAFGLGLPLMIISTFCGHLSKDSLFWRALRGKAWDITIGGKTFFLHTTNLFSGLLLIVLGVALAMGYLTYINNLIPIEVQLWFSEFEEKVLHWFK
jgi:cytochrome c-type biogenesis protein